MRSIAAEILKLHPKNVVNLSNIAITYIVQDDFQQAIPYLLKATEVDPTDTIILSNLARCYEMVGDKENAIRYYKKITQLKEEDMQQYAKQKIEELSK